MKGSYSTNKLNKSWIFRNYRLKNIDSFPKQIRIMFMKSGKKDMKKKNSLNLKFTKFSIYFKTSQYKRRNFLKNFCFILILNKKKTAKYDKKVKRCKLFSIYKNQLLIRLSMIKKKLFVLKNSSHNMVPIFKKKRKEKKKIYSISRNRPSFSMGFKRVCSTFINFSKFVKINSINRSKNSAYSLWILNLTKKCSRFFQKLFTEDQENNFIRVFFTNFLNNVFILKSNIFKFININSNTFLCRAPNLKIYLSNDFSFRLRFLKIKKNINCNSLKKKLKNEQKKIKLKFFYKMEKLIHGIVSKRKTFFNFIVAFSPEGGWALKNLNWPILSNNFKKPQLNSFNVNFFSKFYSNWKSFFFTEIGLILTFILKKKILNVQFYYNEYCKFSKPVYCEIIYELNEIIKGITFCKMTPKILFSEDFWLTKKKYWYTNSDKFFWYIFSKFSPTFLLSPLIAEKLFQKEKKLSKTIFLSCITDLTFQIKEICLGSSKGIKNKKNFQKTLSNNPRHKRAICEKLPYFKQKKKFSSGIVKWKKIVKSNYKFSFKSKFKGFLSLKKIHKTKKFIHYNLKKSKNSLIFESISTPFYLNRLNVDINCNKPFFLPNPIKNLNNHQSIIWKKKFGLKMEVLFRSGYIFFKKKTINLSFNCLLSIVKINQEKKHFNLGKLNIFISKNLQRKTFFKTYFERQFNLKPILEIYDFDFLLRIKSNKKDFNFKLFKKFIKKSELEIDTISIDRNNVSRSKKEIFDYGKFTTLPRKVCKINHGNITDILIYFFQIYKSQYIL